MLGDAAIGHAKDVDVLHLIWFARWRMRVEHATFNGNGRNALVRPAHQQAAYHLVTLGNDIFDAIFTVGESGVKAGQHKLQAFTPWWGFAACLCGLPPMIDRIW